jgi:tetratricopeptide (TPR) repeat protein
MQILGEHEEALKIHSFTLKITEKILLEDPDNEFYQSIFQMNLNSVGTLRNLFYNMGRFLQVKNCYELHLSIFQNLLLKYPENIAYQSYVEETLNDLGALLSDMGRIEEAKKNYEKAFEIHERLLQIDPKNVSYKSNVETALNNLGILLNNMGLIEEAKEKYEKALSMSQEILETDPKNVVYMSNVSGVLNSLGNLYLDIGLIEETKEKYEKALEICEKILKTNPEKVAYQSYMAMILNNLGTLFYNMKRLDEAKDHFEKALAIYETILKKCPNKVEYHSCTGAILNNLGALLSNTGLEEEAIKKYEKALATRQKLREIDPENLVYQSNLAITLNNLGNLLSDLGYNEKAKEMYETALEIFTEPMQYLTISTKSYSIIKLIRLKSKQAENESNLLNQTKFLKEAISLCKKYRDFFIKYELNHERKLVTEAGLSAYIDLSMINVRFERDSGIRAKQYEKALQAVEELCEIENDETVSQLFSSAGCYLRGRKFVNEALASRKPELELLMHAVEQFKNARGTYDKANMCFCVYTGLLKILEKVESFEKVNIPELKKLVQNVVETLPDDVIPSIRSSFDNIPHIFEESDLAARKELLTKLDEEIGNIESKALENLFGHVHEKIKDYFEKPFNLNISYEKWKLKVIIFEPEKIKGKLTVKAGNKILFDRALSKEEIEMSRLEIDYLDIGYLPQGEDVISFTTVGQKKPVFETVNYFEKIIKGHEIRILQQDCSNKIHI